MAKLHCISCDTIITFSMTRYTLKDRKKLCKTCANSLNVTAFSATKMTSDDVISALNNNTSIQKAKIIKQQLADAGVSDTFGTKKEISMLPDILHDDEIIKYATSGFLNAKTILILITDQRLLFLDSGMIYGTNTTEIPLDKINSVSYSKGLLLSTLVVYNGATAIKIDNIANDSIEKLTSEIKKSYSKYENQNAPLHNNNLISPADELKKFKELLDAGVISEKEFDSKKKELLKL
ncbi:PH domain-containing protein [Lactococcus garvieae]|uniref:PH domain-containing protein n=1 Tax=Lactococcus garvieae TaxID=1363 RepID=UPI00254EEADA|nr:PH domain-containing protein [Lactococcus garvieae]